MLKTLDILIGATTVLLIFSMAVTVLTQAVTTAFSRRGAHLKFGLADLLQQLGISDRDAAKKIADAVLRHPMFSDGKAWWGLGKFKLGTVIHREEFTKILMDAASSNSSIWTDIQQVGKPQLVQMLRDNGITDPEATLKNVRSMAMQLEATSPELATDLRQSLALLHEASSDYVARVNSWYDQTIDRVSQRFAKVAHYVTLILAILVVLSVQLDMIAVVDRLSLDEKFRNEMVEAVIKHPPQNPADQANGSGAGAGAAAGTQSNQDQYYSMLTTAGLIVNPLDGGWGTSWTSRKLPGMVLAALLISLGAPFWYNILKNLLGLRSALAQKDDAQRLIRQTTQDVTTVAGVAATTTPAIAATTLPPLLQGERGDFDALG